MDLPQIAVRIGNRILELDLKTSEVAAACGVTPRTVQNWMRGEATPRVETLPALAAILRCDSRWITGERDKVGRPA